MLCTHDKSIRWYYLVFFNRDVPFSLCSFCCHCSWIRSAMVNCRLFGPVILWPNETGIGKTSKRNTNLWLNQNKREKKQKSNKLRYSIRIDSKIVCSFTFTHWHNLTRFVRCNNRHTECLWNKCVQLCVRNTLVSHIKKNWYRFFDKEEEKKK